ncbi:MAG TPA: DNA-binding response regulator [Deltaproteobacteria bacterium]|nr:DNA-binding response regulator [Deltaproteobacteria bacterium]
MPLSATRAISPAVVTRILLAYDHPIFRQGLRSLIEQNETLNVVAEASDVDEAVAQSRRSQPDLAVIDSWLGGLSALEVTRRMLQEGAPSKVLIFCTHVQPIPIDEIVRAGAFGFLSREASREELFAALGALQRGQRYVSGSATTSLFEALAKPRTSCDLSLSRLTCREREVLQLIAEGFSSKEIAVKLSLAVRTVDSHRAHLMDKLDVNKVTGLVRIAIREGLIAP